MLAVAFRQNGRGHKLINFVKILFMEKTIKERIEYLQKQVNYYKSINDFEKSNIYAAVINELSYWQNIYEPVKYCTCPIPDDSLFYSKCERCKKQIKRG